MSLLEQYENQYAVLIAEITSQIGELKHQYGVNRRELCYSIDTNLVEAHEVLEQLGLEIRDLDANSRPTATSKLNCAQVELKRLQTEYRTTKDAKPPKEQTGIDLSAGGDSDYYEDVSINIDQRQRLLENSDRIERTTNRLNEGYRIALETEQLGAQVLTDLSQQRETLQGARSRLRETNADLGRASRTLNTMMFRAVRQKALLYAVGICFVLAIGVSLYITFSSPATTG